MCWLTLKTTLSSRALISMLAGFRREQNQMILIESVLCSLSVITDCPCYVCSHHQSGRVHRGSAGWWLDQRDAGMWPQHGECEAPEERQYYGDPWLTRCGVFYSLRAEKLTSRCLDWNFQESLKQTQPTFPVKVISTQ